jgi:hypothetical protein
MMMKLKAARPISITVCCNHLCDVEMGGIRLEECIPCKGVDKEIKVNSGDDFEAAESRAVVCWRRRLYAIPFIKPRSFFRPTPLLLPKSFPRVYTQ